MSWSGFALLVQVQGERRWWQERADPAGLGTLVVTDELVTWTPSRYSARLFPGRTFTRSSLREVPVRGVGTAYDVADEPIRLRTVRRVRS